MLIRLDGYASKPLEAARVFSPSGPWHLAGAPWRRETDSSTGRAYFWHPTTGAARWTLDKSESERFDRATRARDPAKGLLHYQNRLKKAVRLVRCKKCHVGYLVDEEVAALAYNEAVIAADLADIRKMNRVDASGRPLPKDQD